MKRLRDLSRREREIMDIVYGVGRATAAEVRDRMSDPPSYSAVRATLRILEDKQVLKHVEDGARYVYLPTVTRHRARQSAMQNLLETFFDGSPAGAVVALLEERAARMSEADLQRVEALIDRARREGR
ncbi:MAG: BlaI/MecI/CopY family transcriptional regulator [Candidatus Eisenbacteria bacterium]|uniref:BlaI/MecI/CopY family transcriptional regulator n=1 Tax=Eiseniibacteriota bacterium TaxID=2212470 RepID=A0A849SFF7_UNCEI|nr:BlaI/MecI/CopY family transcriptional regulator [Candidatus Eisenbacteria bacterium]